MHPNVEDYAIKCHQCQFSKAQQLKATCLLHPSDIPNNKSESILMDFIVGYHALKKVIILFGWLLID